MNWTHFPLKIDITRHESLAFEIGTKLEAHRTVLNQVVDSIEALKTYAIVTDLHLEAYQPLQIATIAYEVGRGIVKKNR